MSSLHTPTLANDITGGPKTLSFGGNLQRAIDAHPERGFAVLSCLYLATVISLSHFKLLWLDELITLHIASLSSARAIWNVLTQGADPNPPLTHLLVHTSRLIFGEHELSLRLPAIAGYWIGLLSLFLYLKRRIHATWALAGTILSMGMPAFDYSYESRSYGIFYGLTMLAFFLWSRAVDVRQTAIQRQRALIGMALALVAAISTNYFTVLAFLPIAAGELVRLFIDLRGRRLRGSRATESLDRAAGMHLRVWVALVIAGLPLLIYRPLIERSIAQFAPFAWNKVSMQQVIDSYTQMVEMVLFPILALLALWIIIRLFSLPFSHICANCRRQMRGSWFEPLVSPSTTSAIVPAHEVAGILFLMAYPFLGYIVASVRGGMLSPRFVIPVCFGFAIAAVLAAFQLVGRIPSAGVALLILVTAWFLYRESMMGWRYASQKEAFYGILNHLPLTEAAVPPGTPIVIPDPLLALTFQHYAPTALASREVFPVDFPAIRAYQHDDSPEENLWVGRKSIYDLDIISVASLQQNTGRYLIIATDDSWLLRDLTDHHYPFTTLPILIGANAIGGFTPICRGVPTFYVSAGDKGRVANNSDIDKGPEVIPFRIEKTLPDAKSSL